MIDRGSVRFRDAIPTERLAPLDPSLDRDAPWTRLLPEILALLIVGTGVSVSLLEFLLLPSLIRAALLVSIAWHGLAHALLAGGPLGTRLSGYLRGISWRSLLPGTPLFIPGVSHPAHAPALRIDELAPQRRRLTALAGPAANLALLCALAPMLASLPSPFGIVDRLILLLAGANLWILFTSWSDLVTAHSGVGEFVFCGNFGILSKRHAGESGFLPARFRTLFERIGQVTDVRGQQAGGLAVMSASGRFVGRKIVNDKRSNLTRNLLGAFRRRAALRRLTGARPLRPIIHLIAHYRYGTSSGPSEIETHWHRWLRPRTRGVWSVEGNRLARRKRVVEHLITHNGDFDAWSTAWRRLSNACLGQWLAEILGEPHPAKGDSPKIAGMLDLLLTQGQWDASIRLAYALQTGHALPKRNWIELTRAFEQTFQRWACPEDAARLDNEPCPIVIGCTNLAEVYARHPGEIKTLLEALQQASLALTRDWPDAAKQRRQQIVNRAVHAFFHNDLFKATHLFMERAEGTFGLVTTTSLQPGAVMLAADRQPLFVGCDPEAGMMIYASEAAALRFACGRGPAGTPAPLPYRYDLRDGDLMLLQVHEGTAENTLTRLNRLQGGAPATERIAPERLAESARDGGTGGWIALHDNICLEPVSTARGRDRVLAEMTDIPVVLDRIQRDWDDPGSPNRRTARAFIGCLLDNARDWLSRHPAHDEPTLKAELDLLVLGIENSFYLGERFVEDLRRAFPYLRVQAVDAVSYAEDPQRYLLGPTTLTLAVSHSGQTFNTLDTVKFIQSLHGLDKAGPVFVMTGETDTLMGAAVGQSVKTGAPWIERVFATGAGWRMAEPATVSCAATHACLTQLLLQMIREAREGNDANERPFGLLASGDDLSKLEALTVMSVARAAAVFGMTAEGWEVKTEEQGGLKREGRYLARFLTEPALVFMATALHLFAMLWLGWNPVIGAVGELQAAVDWSFLHPLSTAGQLLLVLLQTAYFLFAGVAFTLLLRWVQGRPLWDRVFVGRTLVIGDEPYVKNLLAQYVSKLFSLAYEFVGFAGIHAADTRSGELLHVYGHRVTRGLLLFLGMPDGRWSGRERAEAAVCMTSSQARGIQHMGTGAIVMGIGHNPALAGKVDRFIQLGVSGRRLDALPWILQGQWSDLARDLQESRFAAFERLLASYVIFHSAAAASRNFMNGLVPLANVLWAPVFWSIRLVTLGRVRPYFGFWDLARTQSGTRIATTAAPVPAIVQDPRDYLTPAQRDHKARETPTHRLEVVSSAAIALAAPPDAGGTAAGHHRSRFVAI
ncbi:hypothetical protein [uncultured Thiocystis sp.]|jgi:hypothetical protein|uniref:hypothetical protein n=1 Tax=uncultured Thiocystis sp. TaxID=1202134 RepID=UPI0025E8B7BF|nr:hypothetical protein [uncultured Thiocystis sp.]